MARNANQSQSQQAITVLAAIAVTAFVVFVVYWARVVLIPLALSILITFVLTPVILLLQRTGLGRVPSVAIVVVVSLVLIAAVVAVVGSQVVQLTQTLPDHADRIKTKVETLKNWLSSDHQNRFGKLVDDVAATVDPATKPAPEPGAAAVVVNRSPSWAGQIQTYLSPAAEVLGQAAFTLILVIFMLTRREDLRNRAIRLLGPGRITTTTKAVDETSHRVSRYLLAQFLLNASFGVIICIGLLLMGVPYPPLWGLLAALMRYVPYVGTWIGVIPPALFTVAISDGWGLTAGVLALYLGLELVVGNFVEPVLYGPRLGLSEVAQLVATAFWAFLWGPVGLILAWPLTTCLLMLGKYVPGMHFLNVLLGDEPVLSSRVAFYQRVAAHDQDEAVEILERQSEDRSPDELFDDLLIPALAQARQDSENGLLSEGDLAFVVHTVDEAAEDIIESPGAKGDFGPRVRVQFLPGKDAVDHAAALVVGRTLDRSLWEVDVAPANDLTSELVARVGKVAPAVVVIVSVAPGGLTHTRYLCKRIHAQFPELKIVVGRWAGPAEENVRATAALRNAGAEEVATTAQATRAFLDGWRTVLAAGSVTPSEPDDGSNAPPKAAIGTLPA